MLLEAAKTDGIFHLWWHPHNFGVLLPQNFSDLVLSAEKRKMLRLQCGFSGDAIVIGCLGRFDPSKDHQNFICAAGLIAKQCVNVYFLMVGHGLTVDNAILQTWIDKTNYKDRFVLLGERTDVAVC